MKVPPRRRKFLLTTLPPLLTLCLFFAFAHGNSIKKNLESFFGKSGAVRKVKGWSEVTPTGNFICLKNCEATSNFNHSKGVIGTYDEESSRFVCYLKCNKSFAYVRWNDGELDTLTGWKSKTRIRMSKLEGWSTEKDTKNHEKQHTTALGAPNGAQDAPRPSHSRKQPKRSQNNQKQLETTKNNEK